MKIWEEQETKEPRKEEVPEGYVCPRGRDRDRRGNEYRKNQYSCHYCNMSDRDEKD